MDWISILISQQNLDDVLQKILKNIDSRVNFVLDLQYYHHFFNYEILKSNLELFGIDISQSPTDAQYPLNLDYANFFDLDNFQNQHADKVVKLIAQFIFLGYNTTRTLVYITSDEDGIKVKFNFLS